MKTIALLFAAFVWLAISPVRAVTLSTLSLSDAGYDVVSWNTWKGQSFSLAAEARSARISSVMLTVDVVVPNSHLVVRVVGAHTVDGTPNMADVRAELFNHQPLSGPSASLMNFEAPAGQSFPLVEPGQAYWVIAGMTQPDPDQSSSSGLLRWHFTNAQNPGSAQEPGWIVGRRIAVSGTAGADWYTWEEAPFLLGIAATPVPEPSGLACWATVGLFLNRRRRFRS